MGAGTHARITRSATWAHSKGTATAVGQSARRASSVAAWESQPSPPACRAVPSSAPLRCDPAECATGSVRPWHSVHPWLDTSPQVHAPQDKAVSPDWDIPSLTGRAQMLASCNRDALSCGSGLFCCPQLTLPAVDCTLKVPGTGFLCRVAFTGPDWIKVWCKCSRAHRALGSCLGQLDARCRSHQIWPNMQYGPLALFYAHLLCGLSADTNLTEMNHLKLLSNVTLTGKQCNNITQHPSVGLKIITSAGSKNNGWDQNTVEKLPATNTGHEYCSNIL